MSRAEVDVQISVKKACNSDEVPPKRKHVRACIVYTWDHKNSRAFWNAVKILPLQSDEIQLFKALITIHKVIQEGHPNTLKDAYRNRDFIYSLGNVFPTNGNSYGRLINQYDKFILQKLDFHRANPGFNGTFEYEEYISLRAVNDPNEGYESLLQLMDLQDSINDIRHLIFVTINQTPNNLCKISAIVPLIAESYGIYKFCTSMLRAMYQQLGADEALTILFDRFNSHHFMLRDFYTDCHAIKFLTSLITIPRLSNSPPNLQLEDGSLPSRPRSVSTDNTQQASSQPTSSYEAPPSAPPSFDQLLPQQTNTFAQQQLEQQQLQAQLELKRQQQLQEQLQQQRLFEEQQRQQEQRFLEEQRMLQTQQTQQQQSRVTELEHDLLMFKNQYDNDQQLLQQYDNRVKVLETDLENLNNTSAQQMASKDEQIRNLEEQIANWIKKYDSLAKLYSQLRQEHLNLLSKFKKIQQKINSAQESIVKKEKLEKDLKAKNIELADLIRERDRARLELDRVKISKEQEIDQLNTEIRELNNQVNESGKLSSLNLSSILSKHQSEMEDMKKQLEERDIKLSSLNSNSVEEKLKEKEIDLEIAQESLDSALRELAIAKNDQDEIVNSQIDMILLKNIDKLRHLIDVILTNNIKTVQDARHELTSSDQAGNMNSSPEYVLSIVEVCSDTATDFATTFNSFIVDEKQIYDDDSSIYSSIILASSALTKATSDLMLNGKGICNNIAKDKERVVLDGITQVLNSVEKYFSELTSNKLDSVSDEEDKVDIVIDLNLQVQNDLQQFASEIEKLRKRSGLVLSGDLEGVVNNEMEQTEQVVNSASKFLSDLMLDPNIKQEDMEVHEMILSAAIAITNAIVTLIKCATESQREIVNKGRGTESRTEFYKKNNRWTEGLISASKAVAGATNILIRTADGVLKHKNSHEQLIVASNEVAASTAQLVAASRVKANFVSKTQENLESASTTVSNACKFLVNKVQSLLTQDQQTSSDIDLAKLTPYEGKTVEMEQQVQILKLENQLNSARKRLGEIRKYGYMDDNSDEEESTI